MALEQSDYTQLNVGKGGDRMATSLDGALKAQKVHIVYRDIDGSLQEVQNDGNRLPVTDIKHTDFSGVIGQNIDDSYTIENPLATSTIGFHLTMPIGGRVEFEGSFDGVNYASVTYREIGGDGFRSHAHADENFIGSVAALRYLRFRNSVTASAPGLVAGRLVDQPCTIEGVEHGNPPHNIGVNIVRFGLDITAPVTDQVLYTPTSVYHPRRIVITGYALSVSGTGTIRIFDETNSSNNWIFSGEVKSNDMSVFSNTTFNPPFVTSAPGNEIKITSTNTAIVTGVITGYEICS